MEQTGFVYNSTKCIFCGACQVACQAKNGLPKDTCFRRVTLRDVGGRMSAYSGGCNHCRKPACVAACPTGAMYRDEEQNIVLHNDGLCIGCGACIWNCPYGAVSFNQKTGVSQKCDSCVERRVGGIQPACVAACPTGALRWRTAEGSDSTEQLKASFLPDPKETEPSTKARFAANEVSAGEE